MEIRTITAGEVRHFRDALMSTFGSESDTDEGADERFLSVLDPAQLWAAFDRGIIVATAGTYALEVVVPGGNMVPMAGLTMVTVRPTHRRRGLLRELLGRHLDDARARGYAISGLWASEARIYRRFGYGISAFGEQLEVAGAHQLTVAAGRELDELEWIDPARASEVLPGVYARAIAARPGALRRSDAWWRRRFHERKGAPRRFVLARRGADIVGSIQFAQTGKFDEGLPDGRVEIAELVGVDARAEATLWRFACSVDLFPTVSYWDAPVDGPLSWLVDDGRRIKRRRYDTLWLRLDDIAAALAARSYASDGVLRIGVGDTTHELVVEGGRGSCTRTSRPAEVTCDIQALASLYLGGTRAAELARADLFRGNPAVADRLFAAPMQPWCPEMF